jgi:hypothetical protein
MAVSVCVPVCVRVSVSVRVRVSECCNNCNFWEILRSAHSSVSKNELRSGLLGFWTLSIVRYSKKQNTTSRKLNLFPSSGEGAGDTCSVGPVKSASLIHWPIPVSTRIAYRHPITRSVNER